MEKPANVKKTGRVNYKWKSEETFRLINLIKCNQCLWNVESSEYRDLTTRDKAISSISGLLRLSIEEVKKKMHSLRTQYTNERSKMKKNLTDGNERYQTKWEYYKALRFMFQHCPKTKEIDMMMPNTESRSEDSTSNITDNSFATDGVDHQSTPNRYNQYQERVITGFTGNYNFNDPGPAIKLRRKEETASFISAARLETISNSKKTTEFDAFGYSVAAQLNNMPFENAIQLQLQIQQLITRQRLQIITRLKQADIRYDGQFDAQGEEIDHEPTPAHMEEIRIKEEYDLNEVDNITWDEEELHSS